ncbi:MAG TPA: hypothetical protein VIF57_16445 [Polyangia bacterium]|jgi:hypothetical protein
MKMRGQARQLLTAAIAAAATSAGGCVVGDGTGSASGMLFMLGCQNGDAKDYGSPTSEQNYDLQPRYFVGEPIEDIADPSDARPAANTLIIRMQHNGNALEITDTLYFTIPDSGKIAKCLRGRVDPATGLPDWDTGTGVVDDPNTTAMGPWCEPPVAPPDGSGFPRIHLIASGPVRVSFTPLGTCASSMHPPAIVSITGVAQEGYVDFFDFGNAMQNDRAPDAREPIGNDFKIDFGQRLRANFTFTMGDDRVLTALKLGVDPPPDPTIGGSMAGNFDFDLTRGQGAQTFP